MPNQRSPGQKLVAFPVDEELLTELDQQRGKLSRSQFIRDALAEYLQSLGVPVREEIVSPPDRTGPRNKKPVSYKESLRSETSKKNSKP